MKFHPHKCLMGFRVRPLLNAGMILFFSLVFSEPGALAYEHDLGEYEWARAAVAAWSTAVKSFRGDYTIYHEHYEGDQVTSRGTTRIHYRFQDKNRLFRMEEEGDGEESLPYIQAMYDGKVSYRYDYGNAMQEETKPGIINSTQMINGDQWGWPRGVFLFPDDVFAQTYGKHPLIDALGAGKARILDRQGQTVLSLRYGINVEYTDVDIWFDVFRNVERIEWCCRFGIDDDNEAHKILDVEPFDVRVLRSVFQFGNYMEVNGVMFPALIRETQYVVNTPKTKAIQEEFRELRIEKPEYVRQMIEALKDQPRAFMREFTLDTGSAEVNIPLTADDFKIDRAPVSYVFDAKTGKEKIVKTWPKLLKDNAPWLVGVLAGIVALGVGAWMIRNWIYPLKRHYVR